MEDPHEICSVIGLDGLRYFLEVNELLTIHIWPQVPSAVPPSHLESSGAEIRVEEVREALSWPGVVDLGEVMAIDQVLENEPRMKGMIDAARQSRQSIEGDEVDSYAAAGAASDHEVHPEDFLEKLRRGITVQLRVGGWWQNDFQAMVLEELRRKLNTRSLMLVSDDRHPRDLQEFGAMDYNVRCAMERGIPVVKVMQMATINLACHFGQMRECGEIAPGRLADIFLAKDLDWLQIETVIANGQPFSHKGERMNVLSALEAPASVRDTVRLPHLLGGDDHHRFCHKPSSINIISPICSKTSQTHRPFFPSATMP